ncbi:MAG: hypothetical protein Q4D26_00830 [Clostridia bacterium]|nr:hypothetical protein [Clostridia bacterium]
MDENKFTKEQLKKSDTFKEYVDIINAFLKDGESYSIDETKEIIQNFLNKGGE